MSIFDATGTFNRRQALLGSAALAGAAALPGIARAQAATVKVGILQPVTGALAFDGQQGQLGAELAIKAVNDAGGIKSLGGAKLEMVFGDARSTPEGGTAEVERMNCRGRGRHRRRLCKPDLPCGHPGGVALRAALHRRCRRRTTRSSAAA